MVNFLILFICVCSISELDTVIFGINVFDSGLWWFLLLLSESNDKIIKIEEKIWKQKQEEY